MELLESRKKIDCKTAPKANALYPSAFNKL